MDLHCDASDLAYHLNATSGTSTPIVGAAVTNGTAVEYSLNLLSFLGCLGYRFPPLHNGYTIQLTLASGAEVFCTDTALGTDSLSYSVSLSYVMQIVELSSEAHNLLMSSVPDGVLQLPCKTYKHFLATQAANATSTTINIGLAASSLSAILFTQRESSKFVYSQWQIPSQRSLNGLSSYSILLGSTTFPSTSGVVGTLEMIQQMFRGRHSANSDHLSTIINRTNYGLSAIAYTDSQTYRGTCAHIFDFESIAGKPVDTLLQGLDCTGSNLSLTLTSTGTVAASKIDLWCEINAVISVRPGIDVTVSF